MIEEYTHHLYAAGRARSTVRQRILHLGILSRQHPDLLSVTTANLEAYLAGMRFTHNSETRRSHRSSMAVFYRWAMKTGRIDSNPAADLAPISVRVKVPRLATDASLQIALANASVEETAMILLGRFACLRLTEISTLHTSQRHEDVLLIFGKGEKEREVYINDSLMEALLLQERAIGGSGYYFPGLLGTHKHPQSVCKIIKRVSGWNPHSLRHAGATASFRTTKDLRAVQLMLGHSSMATTQRYLHIDDDALRAVARGTAFTPPLAA